MTNYFRKVKSLYSSTTNSFGVGESETITPSSVTGLPTDTEMVLTFDRTVSGKLERIKGTVTGGNFVISSGGRGFDGTTEQAHTSPTVEYIPNAADTNDFVTGMLVAHNQTGTHKTGMTLTAPVFATSGDLNGVKLIVDADADSSITADTDDQIDFETSGADAFRMKAKDFDLVNADANITVAGADPKRGIYVPASAIYGATTSGAGLAQYESSTNKVNVKVVDFDKDSDEYACFNLPAPEYWDLGTVTAQFHWTAASGAASNTVVYAIQGLARSNDDALDTAYGTAVTVTDNLITALDEHVTAATDAITIGGTPAKGDMLYFRIYRDVSADDLPADARLLGVRIKFSISQYSDA
jgi:hypothetical protein